jgi:outer membrane lipoprotein-sorting protein
MVKNSLIILFAVTALVLSSCSGSSDKELEIITNETGNLDIPKDALYGMKSGRLTYEASILFQKQVIVISFDDYGAKKRSEVDIDFMGQKMKNITVSDTANTWSWDPETKLGSKVAIDKKSPDNLNFNQISDEIRKEYNIKEEGEEEVSGKTCRVYSLEYKAAGLTGKYYVWKGIALRMETTMKGISMKMKAVKIEENPTIPAEQFALPADVDFSKKVELPS